jgi:hypothetical protein
MGRPKHVRVVAAQQQLACGDGTTVEGAHVGGENFGEKFLDKWDPPSSSGREGKLELADFASQVGLVDGFSPRREKNYLYPKHLSFNTELHLILGK